MEYVDIYNSHREKTGIVREKGADLAHGEYICIAHLVIFNSKDEMLIQKRAANKELWAGYWDISAGGGVTSGETPVETAMRETFEELGVCIDLIEQRPMLTIYYPIGFDDYFIVERDIPLHSILAQQEEVSEVKWADKENILQMTKEGTFVHYKHGFIELLFALKGNRGSYDYIRK